MDEYMKTYRAQMDQVRLSDSVDQAILDDILKKSSTKKDSRKRAAYMGRAKKNISAAMAAAVIAIVTSACCVAGVAIHGAIIKSNKAESQVEGIGARVDVGESSYYDLLAGGEGEIYVLTDNDYTGSLTENHAIAWRSTDQGGTWEEVLFQPNELNEEAHLYGGALREGETGIEAVVIIEEKEDKAEDGYINRVYRITADSYTEYDMDEVYEQLGDQKHLWNIEYVNDHIIALVGTEKCLLYDVNTQSVVKSLPYDLTMGCLKTQDQFLLYGKEIYRCLDAETLEEQEPEEGLQEFVKTMYEKNNKKVLPPMTEWDDAVVCITRAAIYEYKDGEITQVRQLSNAVNGGRPFNGLLPFCKTLNGEYYVCTLSDTGMSLWQIDSSKEEMK